MNCDDNDEVDMGWPRMKYAKEVWYFRNIDSHLKINGVSNYNVIRLKTYKELRMAVFTFITAAVQHLLRIIVLSI